MKQVEAVINAVTEVLGTNFVAGTTVVSDVLTKEQKAHVRQLVLDGILSGEIAYSKDLTDDAALRRYVGGMVDNHLRKSQRLNGGSVYKPTGAGTKRDPQLKELNKLLKTQEAGSEGFISVQQAISNRNAELAQERAAKRASSAKQSIDTSVLPSHLAEMISSSAE